MTLWSNSIWDTESESRTPRHSHRKKRWWLKKGHQNFWRVEIFKFLKNVVLKFFSQMCSGEFFLKHDLVYSIWVDRCPCYVLIYAIKGFAKVHKAVEYLDVFPPCLFSYQPQCQQVLRRTSVSSEPRLLLRHILLWLPLEFFCQHHHQYLA